MTKCVLTKTRCMAYKACFYDEGSSCPIKKYESSSRHDDGKSLGIIDSTCRYYGIARYEKIKNSKWIVRK